MFWGPLARFLVTLDDGKIEITRKSESLLDVIGAIGGFFEAQKILCELLVGSYNTYALQSFLAFNLVRFVPSSSTDSFGDRNEKRKQR